MNTIYDDERDILYIIIYKLGEGRHVIWFAIELINFIVNMKKKILNINYKAIKICENDEDGKTEANINSKLIINKKKCNYINYPTHYFVKNDNLIIIYEVAIGSLYSFSKYAKYDTEKYEKFILKIIPQMIESINFVHNCKLIHTDIKPENFLICGTTKLQDDIINFTKNYHLEKYLPIKIIKNNIDELIKKTIKQFTKKITEKFKLDDITNIDLFNSDDKSSNEGSSDEDEEDDENEVNNTSKIFSDLISNTYESSHVSNDYDFFKEYDKFHTKYILDDIMEQKISDNIENNKTNVNDEDEDDEDDNNNNNNIIYNIESYNYIKKYMDNPTIKLTDFEYLINDKSNDRRTMQNRCCRSPEIILGLKYTYKSDYWAFGSTLYELMMHCQLIDIKNDDDYEILDNDLINIKLLIEKFNNATEYINLIKSSGRKDYLITDSNILKFINKYEYKFWKNDMKNINTKIVNLIEINLNVNPDKRLLTFE